MLTELKRKNVPLAVLWTDQPEIYAGRGFVSAGWEMHIDLEGTQGESAFPAGFALRDFAAGDADAVQELFDRHQLRTVRQPGDAVALYTMPGTRGLVATGAGGAVLAAVFCGKGADFPDYVAEWSGPLALVSALIGEAHRRGWARYVLAPPGSQQLVEHLVSRGAGYFCQNSGQWAVLQPDGLSRYLQAAGAGAPRDVSDPRAVLGSVDEAGDPVLGPITCGIWGLDSV